MNFSQDENEIQLPNLEKNINEKKKKKNSCKKKKNE